MRSESDGVGRIFITKKGVFERERERGGKRAGERDKREKGRERRKRGGGRRESYDLVVVQATRKKTWNLKKDLEFEKLTMSKLIN